MVPRQQKKHVKQNHANNKECIKQREPENISYNICGCQSTRKCAPMHQKTKKCKLIANTASNVSTSAGSDV